MFAQAFLKQRYCEIKDYDAIISVHDVTNKIILINSNLFVDLVIWQKFGNSSISSLQGFYQKKQYF